MSGIETTSKSIMGNIIGSLKSRPDIIAMLIVVGAFLYHIQKTQSDEIKSQERRESREDLVANQRIAVCHDIQIRGIEALDRNTAALLLHASSDAGLSGAIDILTDTVDNHTEALSEVRIVLASLLSEIDLHKQYTQHKSLN